MISHTNTAFEKQDSSSLLNSAFQNLKRGALDHAESVFQGLFESSDGQDRAKALNGLGLVATQRGQIVNAVSLFRQAVEIDPDFTWARQNMVQVCIGQAQRQAFAGKPKDAEAILDTASEFLSSSDIDAIENAHRIAIGSTY